ncbi:MAG: hypothetical protein ACI89M_001061, partial [Chitinophagales bacterium]
MNNIKKTQEISWVFFYAPSPTPSKGGGFSGGVEPPEGTPNTKKKKK